MNLGDDVIGTNVSITHSEGISVDNPILHTWKNSTGDMGLAYCYGSEYCTSTSFQQILAQSTSVNYPSGNQTFGLDFRNPNSSIASVASVASSMQLGGVASQFADNLTWSVLPSPGTIYFHQFMLQDISFCGASLLANISRVYPVLVDTGSSCLTLPKEMYIHFESWLDGNAIVSDPSQLPAFTFQMTGENNELSPTLYIPLATLLINPGSIITEKGAPFITIQDNVTASTYSQRLCVLEGPSIGHPYSYPAPSIVFGALTLQSLYFAANYATYSMALSNKLSTAETEFYRTSSLYCQAPQSCSGEQTYSSSKNICKTPRCDKYFFTELNVETQTCVASTSPYYFGIIFLSIIIAMECFSFFVGQYSGFLLLTMNHSSSGSGNGTTDRRILTQNVHQLESTVPLYRIELPIGHYRVGYLTLYLGKWCSQFLDLVFQFSVPPTPLSPPPSIPTSAEDNSANHLHVPVANNNINNNDNINNNSSNNQNSNVSPTQQRQRGGVVAVEV